MTGHEISVRRRRFLMACAGGLAAFAGCSKEQDGLTGTSLHHRDPKRFRARRPIIVAFDEDNGVITVTGFMAYGSSSCGRIELKEASYDRPAGVLTARIAPGRKPSLLRDILGLGCHADIASAHYRAKFQFAGELPTRVTIVEEGAMGNRQRRTVDRKEQHERCSRSHTEGSEAAITAHWTCPEEYIATNASSSIRQSS